MFISQVRHTVQCLKPFIFFVFVILYFVFALETLLAFTAEWSKRIELFKIGCCTAVDANRIVLFDVNANVLCVIVICVNSTAIQCSNVCV